MPGGDEAGLGDDRPDGELRDGRRIPPGRVDDQDIAPSGGIHVDVDRTSTRDRNQLEVGQALEHRRRERREVSNDNVRVVDKANDIIRVSLVFLEAVHSRRVVAVFHRLVGPGHFQGFDLEPVIAAGADRLFEHRWQHEAIAGDRDLRLLSARPAHSRSSRLNSESLVQVGAMSSRTMR
jgi:hypothetical protein